MATTTTAPEIIRWESLDQMHRHAAIETEGTLLRDLRDSLGNEACATRIRELLKYGWQVSQVADLIGVTRVSVSKWTSKLPAVDLDPAPIVDFRSPAQRQRDTGLRLRRVKVGVPDALADPLQALWRIAYTHRYSTAEEQTSRAASDALDVMLSILLRRGVTFFAIAEAADVTHRAVMDRMRRASLKCRVFCDGDKFAGYSDLGSVWLHDNRDQEMVLARATISNTPGSARVRFSVLHKFAEPVTISRFGSETELISSAGFDHGIVHDATTEEDFVAKFTGKHRFEPGVYNAIVQQRLLYVHGWWTMNQSVQDYFPEAMWTEFYKPHPQVLDAVLRSELILGSEKYPAIKKTGLRSPKL